ncbi:hypothetical protein [Pseudochryseolinea flava]|uniref:Uncharacterized protein n=1 Tax=Pseudochryseolinea flava TaxID=2059302 RepID=A0A364Y917_9BACT|nr:hypothetical protein [Pseudochryseolinea flava]RAW03440.1 hypothetical protein DQQ10_04965 [Pseudochryseolinea flava]
MSSHHFVKEGQEPALFIVNALSYHAAEPLLEWAPLVVVSEGALEDVLIWGIKIDAVITNHDHDTLADKIAHQHPIAIIPYGMQEDFIKVGIDFLRTRESTAVNVMADVSIADFSTAHQDLNFQCSLLNKEAKWSLIRNRHFEKWMEGDATLMLHCGGPGAITVEGALRVSNAQVIVKPHEGLVKVRSDQDFWVGEAY